MQSGVGEVTKKGLWMAACARLLASGAVLSHESAAELYGIWKARGSRIHVTTSRRGGSHEGIAVHRTKLRAEDIGTYAGIPVTSPARTLTDLAAQLQPRHDRTRDQ